MALVVGVLALQGAFHEHRQCLERMEEQVNKEHGVQLVVKEVRCAGDLRVAPAAPSSSAASADPGTSPLLIDGLIIPGGESTVMLRLLNEDRGGLTEELQQWIQQGRPVFGTCAGAILLANQIVVQTSAASPGSAEPASPLSERAPSTLLGGMRVSMARNWYGRQLASFECSDLVLAPSLHSEEQSTGPGVFIRAPAIVDVAQGVEVLATLPSQEQHRRNAPADADKPSVAVSSLHAVAVRDGSLLATCFHPELSQDTRWHRLFVNMCLEQRAALAKDAEQ